MTDGRQLEFLRLYASCSADLYGLVWRLHPKPSEVDDLHQELSLRLWTLFDRYEPDRDFAAWARGVCRLVVMEHRRRASGQVQMQDATIELLADASEEAPMALAEKRQALRECIEGLAAADRNLIRSRYQEKALPKDLAATLGRSVHSVYRSLSRVHRNLADCVGRRLAAN